MGRRDLITPVSKQVPFDATTGRGFDASTEVQSALEHLRDHTVYVSNSTTTTASGNLNLTNTDKNLQYLTGTATGYSVVLPNATTLTKGAHYQIINTSSQPVNTKNNAGELLQIVSQTSIGYYWLQDNSTAAGTWVYWQVITNTATGIVRYNLISATNFNTTSTSDVPITGFTLTPQAGTYAIWYNAKSFLTTTPKAHWWTIYKAGSAITDSERQQDTAHSNQEMVDTTMTITQVNGSQALDVRVRTENGTLTIRQRSLLLIRLGT